jgi:hypothetical protein
VAKRTDLTAPQWPLSHAGSARRGTEGSPLVMSWKRSLFRIWLIASICWLGYSFWNGFLICRFATHLPDRCQHETPWLGIAIFGFSGPLIALAIGKLLLWIGQGHR